MESVRAEEIVNGRWYRVQEEPEQEWYECLAVRWNERGEYRMIHLFTRPDGEEDCKIFYPEMVFAIQDVPGIEAEIVEVGA